MNHIIWATLLALMFSSCQNTPDQTSASAPEGPPNIVLFYVDDLGYGDLSGYGHPNIYTPRLDQLALEGAKLTAFYTAAPVCTPSRAALLTGRYPIRFGMENNEGPDTKGGMPAEEITMAEALKEVGYQTAAFGKWHLGSVEGHFPTQHGFDEYFGILYSNDMMPPWVQTERPLHLYRGTEPTEEYPVDQTTLTKRYTEEAIRFIKERDESPFFVYIPHAMPHLPIYASESFDGSSLGGQYGDVIEEIDWSVGQVLDAIDAEGLRENTIFIFTSDNGPWNELPPRMYETEEVEKWHAGTQGPFRGSKASTWEGGHRVPFIVRWPGQVPEGVIRQAIATNMDLYPTLLEAAGATIPDDRPLDGKNMMPLLVDNDPDVHDYFYYFRSDRLEAIRDHDWKLNVKPEIVGAPVTYQLFNLHDDPYERFNVADAHPDVVDRLYQEMVSFGLRVTARVGVVRE